MSEGAKPDSDFNYPAQHVAFLDVLGFRDKVMQIEDNRVLFNRIRNLQDTIQRLKIRVETAPPIEGWNLVFAEMKVNVFSDSIIISASEGPTALVQVVDATLSVCRVLICNGALVRGEVSTGRLHHEGGMIFGEAMIRAYDLERDIAKNPRVVLDTYTDTRWDVAMSRPMLRGNAPMVVRDRDGMAMLDLFEPATFQKDSREVFYQRAGEVLTQMLQNRNVRLRDWTKIVWIADRFNAAVRRNGYAPELTIEPFRDNG